MTHPPYDLLREAWMPVRLASGERVALRPAEALARDDARRPDWGRADLDMASFELLIGLAAVAATETGNDPAELYRDPPDIDWLDTALLPFSAAFALDGDGYCFCQDIEPGADWKPKPVQGLLIDAPGENTARKGHDLFTRDGAVARLSPGAAAIALYALQAFAPSGGAGHRTSMRGGGPMTTLVIPVPDAALRAVVWANAPKTLPIDNDSATAHINTVFPWLMPTRTSKKGETVTPGDAHPLHAFFGMPRRIRLDVVEAPAGATCDLTGAPLSRMVTIYRTMNYGINYETWVHPLTPHYLDKKDVILPLHPRPGRFAYGDWPGIVVAAPGGNRRRAGCVDAFGRRGEAGARPDLLVAGWATDNMTPLQYIEARAPLAVFDTDAQSTAMIRTTGQMIDGADAARRALLSAVQAAKVEKPRAKSGVAHDAAFRQGLAERFWAETEGDFRAGFEAMRRCVLGGGVDEQAVLRDWGHALRRRTLALFDEHVGVADLLRAGDTRRVVNARATLSKIMHGTVPKMNPVWKALGAAPKADAPAKEPA